MKKCLYYTTMAPPEEVVNHKSKREYHPLPKQAEVKPLAKHQCQASFTSLPNNMFYTNFDLIPSHSLLLFLQLILVHHLVLHVSLPLVLWLRLVFLANVLGQEGL